jgi:hypothetical protein
MDQAHSTAAKHHGGEHNFSEEGHLENILDSSDYYDSRD